MPADPRLTKYPILALSIPALILGLILASSGFDLLPELGVFNAKRVLEPLVFGAALVTGLLSPELRRAYARQCARIPPVAMLVIAVIFTLGAVSALRFPNAAYGLADITLLGLIVLLVPLLAACRQVAGVLFDRLCLLVIAALGLVVAFTEFTGLLAGWSLGTEFGFDEMLVRFAHARFYNQLQSWTIPLLAAIPLLFGMTLKRLAAAIVLIGLQWAILLMSGGRGTFVALILGLLVVAAVSRPAWRSWPRTHLFGLLFSLVIFGGILAGHSLFAPSGGEFVEQSVGRSLTDSTGRTHMWSLALRDAAASPWLGVGPMRYACDGPALLPAHPHSFPMQILSEWGIPAFLLTAGLFSWLAWSILKMLYLDRGRSGQETAFRNLLVACVLTAALHACLSGVLIMPASQMMAVVICGWLYGLVPAAPPPEQPRMNRIAPAFLLAGLVACVSLTAFNIYELRQYEARTGALASGGPVQPRYWQHGRFCLYTGY